MAEPPMSVFTIAFGMTWLVVAAASLNMSFVNHGHEILDTVGIALISAALSHAPVSVVNCV